MSRKTESAALAAKRARDRERAEKFARETWTLPPDQRHEAHKLTHEATELLMAIARHGGIDIGEPGSELTRLEGVGFVEITNGDGRRAKANITHAGTLALLCSIVLRREANQPKRAKRRRKREKLAQRRLPGLSPDTKIPPFASHGRALAAASPLPGAPTATYSPAPPPGPYR